MYKRWSVRKWKKVLADVQVFEDYIENDKFLVFYIGDSDTPYEVSFNVHLADKETFWMDETASETLTFEEVLMMMPREIKDRLLFHLDVFS